MPATQIDRPFRIKTSLGPDVLLLESFVGSERISTPYRYTARVLAESPVDMKGLLSKPVVLSYVLTDDTEKERHVHGNVSRVALVESAKDDEAMYEVEFVPWIWFLHHFSDCRIFQNKSVPEIIEAVFKSRGFPDYQLNLTATYEPREYCVQYRETDFNFVSRLMEEEGIFYFFQHDQSKHTLVLADANSAFETCPNKDTARYTPSLGGRLDEDTVVSIDDEVRVTTAKISLTDYDFEKPNTDLFATLDGDTTAKGEIYDYPAKYKTKDEGSRYTRLRVEEQEVDIEVVNGKSNCMAFQSGFKFTLKEHYLEAPNREYVLVGVNHVGRNTSYRSGSTEPFSYTNTFECIPSAVPFRPPRLARKPVIAGTQTAVVVGKSGEEIWTDKYGRVVVQFFWDRDGTADENSSCWVRVAQGWAGKQWGALHIPRVGHEVVVTFLEGDPDRPLITGSVYNADQEPPFTLPDDQTKSTLKSLSSKGGGGFNEIRMEDKKDSEQIFIHAQKDFHLRVKNDRKEWIGKDRHLVVTRDKMEKIGRDDHTNVARDQVVKIGRDHHVKIEGKEAIQITGTHSLKVTGDVIEEFTGNHSSQVTQNLYLKGMQVVIEGMTGLTLKVGGSFVTLDASGVAIKGPMVQINSAGAALSGSAGSLVSPLAPTDAADADTADPGASSTPTATPKSRASMSLETISPETRSGSAAAADAAASAATDAPTHNPNAPENQDKTHWIEIQLIGEDGKGIPGEPYRITLPDGTTVADGTLDNNGSARVEHIDSGTCKVTFPNLDKDAWESC